MEQRRQFANASNTASLSAVQEPRTSQSASFPPGAGDTAFITIDNVVFHVDRALLRYSSRVFGTIFEREVTNDRHTNPLRIEAEAATFEYILAFIHPILSSPSIDDIRILAALFRLAKRYEMEGVLHQLRRSLVEVRVVEDRPVLPWYKREPLAALVVAHAFDCITESRLALRECLKGPLEAHVAGAASFDIPAEVMGTVLRLRKERLDLLATKLNPNGGITNTDRNCFYCAMQQAQWRFNLLQHLQSHLQLSKLRDTLPSGHVYCANPHSHLVECQITPETIDAWSQDHARQEEGLP